MRKLMGNPTAKSNTPMIFQEAIIKQAAIKSGIVNKNETEKIDKFLAIYKALMHEYNGCIVLN